MYRRCVFCGWGRKECLESVKFYCIPKTAGLQRLEWMRALADKRASGFKKVDSVCSIHFRLGKPSSDPRNEDFVPHLHLVHRDLPDEVRRRVLRHYTEEQPEVMQRREERLKQLNTRMKRMRELKDVDREKQLEIMKNRKRLKGRDPNAVISAPLHSVETAQPSTAETEADEGEEINVEVVVDDLPPIQTPSGPVRRAPITIRQTVRQPRIPPRQHEIIENEEFLEEDTEHYTAHQTAESYNHEEALREEEPWHGVEFEVDVVSDDPSMNVIRPFEESVALRQVAQKSAQQASTSQSSELPRKRPVHPLLSHPRYINPSRIIHPARFLAPIVGPRNFLPVPVPDPISAEEFAKMREKRRVTYLIRDTKPNYHIPPPPHRTQRLEEESQEQNP